MTNWVKLTRENGDRVWMNLNLIVEMYTEEGLTTLRASNRDTTVLEAPDEILRLGENA